jgi:hypothetical protein
MGGSGTMQVEERENEGLQGGLCLTERGRKAAHAVRGSRD